MEGAAFTNLGVALAGSTITIFSLCDYVDLPWSIVASPYSIEVHNEKRKQSKKDEGKVKRHPAKSA